LDVCFVVYADVDYSHIAIPQMRSSQLSKTLEEVLKDKDALAYFIPYLEVRGVVSLVRFWLVAETFRLSASERCNQLACCVDGVLKDRREYIAEDSTCLPLEFDVSSSCRDRLCDQTNEPLNEVSSSALRHRHSDAHGHCREHIAVVQQHATPVKSNFTDTGVYDPHRGINDRLSESTNCCMSYESSLAGECSVTVSVHHSTTNGGRMPITCDSPVFQEQDVLVSTAQSRSQLRSSESVSQQESLRRSEFLVFYL